MISPLAQRIEALLPQTQCTKCGFDGCAPYAQAIADGTASYNQCPPGGDEGVARLAALLERPIVPLNPENGVARPRHLAVIDETVCIGCTLCIQACPVDAIIGAAKQMHTVLIDDCTGCDLCVAPCPVDCIEMVAVTGDATGWQAWTPSQADAAKQHYQRHLARLDAQQQAAQARALARQHAAAEAQSATRTADGRTGPTGATGPEATSDTDAIAAQARKRAIIEAAMARARLRQQTNAGDTTESEPPKS